MRNTYTPRDKKYENKTHRNKKLETLMHKKKFNKAKKICKNIIDLFHVDWALELPLTMFI